jgi:sugar lactone lactonase YvrE
MLVRLQSVGPLALGLLVALTLLGCPRIGSAAGRWSVISLPQKPGEVIGTTALAVDTAGNLYVADFGRIQRLNTQGNWSVLATEGDALGQVDRPSALAVDAAGSLYILDNGDDGQRSNGRIQKRDAQGTWSVIATQDQVSEPLADADRSHDALAVDTVGNLYVAQYRNYGFGSASQIQERDAQGNWSVIAEKGADLGLVSNVRGLAVDAAGSLYVADSGDDGHDNYGWRIQRLDTQGNWSVLATEGDVLGQVDGPSALAVDTAGGLYVAESAPDDNDHSRVQKRDAQGNWSVIATTGTALGQIFGPTALAVDAAGSLYVANSGRIQQWDAQGRWSVVAAPALGQVDGLTAVAVDTAGNLYVADHGNGWRIQQRDTLGKWSVIAAQGTNPGQVHSPSGLTVDAASNLYVADYENGNYRIQERDARGDWSRIALGYGTGLGQVQNPTVLAADAAGNLYVADGYYRIQKRDGQGRWSVIATGGTDLGQVYDPTALATDAAGNLYVAEGYASSRIQKRDAQGRWSVIALEPADALAVDAAGNLYAAGSQISGGTILRRDAPRHWSVFATQGSDLGQVEDPTALAVDGDGNLYVADIDNQRVQEYTPGGP